MKRYLPFTLASILILLVAISLAYNSFPRSVDPSLIREEYPSPIQLLSLYASIGGFAAKLDFKSAMDVLSALEGIYVPQNILYIFQRFNSLLNETLIQMDITKHYVNLASSYISISDFKEAEKYVYNASKSLTLAKMSYKELYDASSQFSRSIGIYYDKLAGVLRDIETGINELEASINMLWSEIGGVKPKLINVYLNLSVEPLSVIYGGEIVISGSLYSENNCTLPFRDVIVHVGGKAHITETNSYGNYIFKCKITEYVPKIQVYAEYIPKDDDVGIFSYAKSDTVYVNVEFITPKVNIIVYPSKVKPMDYLSIFVETIPHLKLMLSLFDIVIEGYTNGSGLFTAINLRVPYNALEGYHSVLVRTFPDGIIGPSSNSSKIIVYKLDPDVRVDLPQIIFSGIPFQIKVSTNVNSSISIISSDLNVNYICKGFNATISLVTPISYLGENVKFHISIEPEEPWIRGWHGTLQVRVINTPALITLIVTVSVLIIGYKRRLRIRVGYPVKEGGIIETSKISMPQIELSYQAKLFYELINLIKAVFGILMKPSDTIREYISKLSQKLPEKLFHPLRQVLLKYEKAIYMELEHDRRFMDELIDDLKGLIKRLMGD